MPTVLHRLNRWAIETPDSEAQRFKKGGKWVPISAKEYMDSVHALACFMESKGITSSDIGCVLAPNRPQWVHVELGMLLVGGKSAGLYPNSTSKDIVYILNQTEAKVLSVQNEEFFKKILEAPLAQKVLERLSLVIVFDGDAGFFPKAITYDAALAEGRDLVAQKSAKSFAGYLEKVDPDTGAFMIYTSGTTGNPKGALLSHDNLVFTTDTVAKYWNLPFGSGSMFSFLPLCHVAEKLQNIGVGISQRYRIDFCTKFDHVAIELPEVQPTLLLSVPRLWEKMMDGVINKVGNSQAPRKRLAEWALATGARVAEIKFSGNSLGIFDLIKFKLADGLVLSKIRRALGLGQAKLLASGAAALPAHVAKWFRSLGLEILEDFGQTESTGVICMTESGVDSAGTVGKPVPGIEMRIADDGEILTRGRHVFKGYFKDPASTADAVPGGLSGEGWLHTGDLGEVTERGLVRIRGRKKEILKTSGGKMVAPLPIEEALKVSPIISQVCMVGDGRKYFSALVTLSEAVMAELKNKQRISDATIVDDPEIIGQIRKYVEQVNKTLASFEQVKRFTVLANEFSITNGEMTPTLKMKRSVIENNYRNVIDRMYSN
ncbi:MAG: long-chain fatty acid--CoA ligase [Bdellovibrionota bacterium]